MIFPISDDLPLPLSSVEPEDAVTRRGEASRRIALTGIQGLRPDKITTERKGSRACALQLLLFCALLTSTAPVLAAFARDSCWMSGPGVQTNHGGATSADSGNGHEYTSALSGSGSSEPKCGYGYPTASTTIAASIVFVADGVTLQCHDIPLHAALHDRTPCSERPPPSRFLAPNSAGGLANEIGILRSATRGKGNFGVGSANAADAARLGEAWVGQGAKVASDGKTLISADGLRQFRPPSFKPNLDRVQANFEQRWVPEGPWQGNGHLDIVP